MTNYFAIFERVNEELVSNITCPHHFTVFFRAVGDISSLCHQQKLLRNRTL